MATCIVSFVDSDGLRHSVEVEAESLYEAAVLAIRTFRQHNCLPGLVSKLEVEIRSSVTHTVTPAEDSGVAGRWSQESARVCAEGTVEAVASAMTAQ